MEDVNTNLFLTSWLKGKPISPGLTVNNLLDAKNGLKFQVLYYCLGNPTAWNSYNLFLSSEPILLNQNNLPSWIQTDLTLSGSQWISNTTYRLKTFSDIYTYAMNVRNSNTQFLNWASLGSNTPKKTFTSILDTTTQTAIKVSYYSLRSGVLSGTAFKQTGSRTLPKKQIKCYPINLMKDIDSNGNVVVDSNNVPMSTKDVKNNAQGATMDVKLDPAMVQSQNNTAVFIFAIIIGVIAGALVLGVVFYVFASSKVASLNTSLPAPLPAPPLSLPAPLPAPPLPASLSLPTPAPLSTPTPLPNPPA